MDILKTEKFKCIVSSVLNKDVRQHGKNFMFDSEDDTSWSSNQGKPQWICLAFEDPQSISSFQFQFQGGFVGMECSVSIYNKDGAPLTEEPFYPDDINSIQTFSLKTQINDAYKVRFIFNDSSDFFGRIIVYSLEILK